MSDIITLASGAVIILVFLLFCFEERKLYSIKEILVKLVNSENILDSLNNSKIASLGEKYEKTIIVNTKDGKSQIYLHLNLYMTTACVNATR